MTGRAKRIRWPALAAAAVLVAGSGTAYAVAQDPAGSYRTTRAATGDVEQVLSTSGTVDAAHRSDLEFATSGTVATVAVAVGDTVKARQVVARLDSSSLRAAVNQAQASVAKAVAQLQSDEDAQAQAVASSASAQQDKPRGSSSGSTGTTAAVLQQVKQQQAAVVTAQSAATGAIAAAREALTAQTAACADAYQDAAPSTRSSSGSADTDPASSSPGDTACADALALVQARQADVSAAQDDLQKALDELAATLGKALAGSTGGSGSTNARSSAASSADSSGPSATSATSAGQVSAAKLAADQAGIEKARADLVAAQQQLGQAVLRSTRSGRVVSVPVSRGDRVSAGDPGAVVVGGTTIVITASVPESKIAQVKTGQPVRVTTPGRSGGADGTVTAIGLVADTSSGTASYPVTVTVEDPAISLPPGSQAMLGIVVATAHDVVTVPISAITRRGDSATVRTWDGHALTVKAVTVGIVGTSTVQVAGGLGAGDEVVLADLDQAITGASDSVNDRGGFAGPPGGFDRGGSGGPRTFLRPAG